MWFMSWADLIESIMLIDHFITRDFENVLRFLAINKLWLVIFGLCDFNHSPFMVSTKIGLWHFSQRRRGRKVFVCHVMSEQYKWEYVMLSLGFRSSQGAFGSCECGWSQQATRGKQRASVWEWGWKTTGTSSPRPPPADTWNSPKWQNLSMQWKRLGLSQCLNKSWAPWRQQVIMWSTSQFSTSICINSQMWAI